MIANLHIQTTFSHGITRLQQSYCTPPFKVANITEDKKAGRLHLMLMSSSPGILDEDAYHIKTELGEQSDLQLHTQSYQRLFRMKKGARQCMEVYLQKGASLVYIPHPSVPHGESVFTAHNTICMQEDSRLIWGEIVTCGRKLNGEQFHFSKYHSITDVFINNRLVIKENFLVQPAVTAVHTIGQWEGYTHQASLIILDKTAAMNDASHMIHDYLLQQKEMAVGISTPACAGIIVRLLGYKAEQLYNCLQTIAALITATPSSTIKPATYAG